MIRSSQYNKSLLCIIIFCTFTNMRNCTQILVLSILLIACDDDTALDGGDAGQQGIKTISKYKKLTNESVLIYKKEFSENGNITSFVEYSEDGNVRSKSKYVHSSRGFTQNKEVFSPDGTVEEISIDHRTGEDGELVKSVEYNGLGDEKSATSFSYDSNGNLIEIQKCVDLLEKMFSNNGTLGSSASNDCNWNEFLSYDYSGDGQIQNIIAVDRNGDFLWRDSIVYTSGSSLLKISVASDGSVYHSTEYAYNQRGEIVSEIRSSPLGRRQSEYNYIYAYYW